MDHKKLILGLALILSGAMFFAGIVYSSEVSLSFLPVNGNKNVGIVFKVYVQINPEDNKVCVAKGKLDLENLTCLNINMPPGYIAQKIPTCEDPTFVIGIPKCITSTENILSVEAVANSLGQAKIKLFEADIIGAGTRPSFVTADAIYNIIAAPIVSNNVLKKDSSVVNEPETKINPENTKNDDIQKNVGVAGFSSLAGNYFWPLSIIFIIICLGYLIYHFIKNKN